MKLLTLTLASMIAAPAFGATECTKEPKEKWQDQKTFEEKLRKEYKVKVFKVTKGNCYEIYGWNKEGKKIEIYFNPVTGEKVKEEIK